jgi:hypothetical protein
LPHSSLKMHAGFTALLNPIEQPHTASLSKTFGSRLLLWSFGLGLAGAGGRPDLRCVHSWEKLAGFGTYFTIMLLRSPRKLKCVRVDDIVRSVPVMLCYSLPILLAPIGRDPWTCPEERLRGASGYNGEKLKNGLEQKSETLNIRPEPEPMSRPPTCLTCAAKPAWKLP